MIRFNNDYNRGAFDCILKALADTNTTSYPGYGEDEWCDKAEQIINGLIGSCLLYTSPSPRDVEESRMPSSA